MYYDVTFVLNCTAIWAGDVGTVSLCPYALVGTAACKLLG